MTQIIESVKTARKQSTLDALGDLHVSRGRYAQAISAYEEAISAGPPSYTIWAGLGVACRHARREAEAVRAFSNGLKYSLKGVRNYPREAGPIAWCAYYHGKLGEAAPTRSLAAQALALEAPPKPSTRKLLAIAYDSIGDVQAALRLLDGAPAELPKELAHGKELSQALRRDPGFKRLIR
jgi:Flp pilus assembly protein TadD